MAPTIIVLSTLALLAFFLLFKGVRIVKQSEEVIIERFGKYHKTLTSGFNIIIPIMDAPRQIAWRFTQQGFNGEMISLFKMRDQIDLRENVYDFPKQNVITRDNVVTEINALIYFQIVDSLKNVEGSLQDFRVNNQSIVDISVEGQRLLKKMGEIREANGVERRQHWFRVRFDAAIWRA